jgi:hypothetical protein
VLDGSAPPARVADEVGALVAAGLVHGVVGWHISAVRQQLAPRVAGLVPYVYTALYEGGRAHSGCLPGRRDALQASFSPPCGGSLRSTASGAGRWSETTTCGPRGTARAARSYAELCAARIVDEVFVPLGTAEFDATIERIERCNADGVLMLLVGEDAVHFNRAFSRAGLDARCRRLSTLMEENILLASGFEATQGMFRRGGLLRDARDT